LDLRDVNSVFFCVDDSLINPQLREGTKSPSRAETVSEERKFQRQTFGGEEKPSSTESRSGWLTAINAAVPLPVGKRKLFVPKLISGKEEKNATNIVLIALSESLAC
jgi:hypothetical protein